MSGATERQSELVVALRTMAERFARLGRAASDPNIPIRATPGWTLTDAFGHVAADVVRYRELARGAGDWPSDVADLPAFNAEQIRTLPTRDLHELSDRLDAATEALVATIIGFEGTPPMMRFDGDQRIRADVAMGTLLGELVVHGHDIARELRVPWPIERRLVPLIMDGLHQVMPGWVDPVAAAGHTAVYRMVLRGVGCHLYAFCDGRLAISAADGYRGRVDVHISAEPACAVLSAYGRVGRWQPALTGRMVAWGRRPWLAVGLPGRFRSP